MIRAAILCVCIYALSATGAVARQVEDAPFIAVQGRAEMRVVPDLFPLTVSIADTSMEAAKAQANVEDAARQIVAQARKQGLIDADIELSNVRTQPQVRYESATEKETFLGTEYSRRILLRFHSLPELRTFIASVPSSKLISIDTGEFQLQDISKVRNVLFLQAIENAQKTAGDVAKALGKRIIGVQTVSDQPLALTKGSYLSGFNPIDVSSVESTAILTAEQIARIPVPRNATSVALVGDPHQQRATEIALSEGVIRLTASAYVVYRIGD